MAITEARNNPTYRLINGEMTRIEPNQAENLIIPKGADFVLPCARKWVEANTLDPLTVERWDLPTS